MEIWGWADASAPTWMCHEGILAGGYHDFLAQDPQMSLGDIAMSIA